MAYPESFTNELIQYCRDHEIPPDAFACMHQIPRYLRINPRKPVVPEDLIREIPSVATVDWFPGCVFAIPQTTRLADIKSYTEGRVYGMDAGSICSVIALAPEPGHRVLDLCCAPGMKLCLIADCVGTDELIGVDVSFDRLFVTRALVRKYGVGNVTLVHGDGTKLTPESLSSALSAPSHDHETHRKFLSRVAKRARTNPGENQSPPVVVVRSANSGASEDGLFDRVLIDAECTHDGSLFHLKDGSKVRSMNLETGSNNISELQLRLITSAFGFLRKGGRLVYSTCSFSESQNENVVRRFLSSNPQAELVPLFAPSPVGMFSAVEIAKLESCSIEGSIQHTRRFDPRVSNTSFQFVAAIRKG